MIDSIKTRVQKTYVVEPWDTLSIAGITIETLPAYNIGKQFHPKAKNYVGFIVHTSRGTIYHAGDTDLIPEMKGITTDVALLPVGGKFTMDAREAASAAEIIHPKVAIPMHYGSIIGTRADADLFAALCNAKDKINVRILKPLKRSPSGSGQSRREGKP